MHVSSEDSITGPLDQCPLQVSLKNVATAADSEIQSDFCSALLFSFDAP